MRQIKKLISVMKKVFTFLIAFFVIIFLIIISLPMRDIVFWLSSGGDEDDMKLASQLRQEALEKNDITICRKVTNGYFLSGATPKAGCTERVLLKTGDYTLCNSVNMEEYQMDRDQCYVVVSEVVNDINVCENISPKNLYQKGRCIGNIARNNHNINLCKNQKDVEIKRICLLEYPEEEDVAVNYLLTLK